MDDPKKNGPSVFFDSVYKILKYFFEKISKLIDKVLFNRNGSVIVSLLLSIVICCSINYNDLTLAIFNSTTTVDLNDIPVEVVADTDTYDITGIPSSVKASLSGDATSIQVFRSKGSIKAVADLSKYSEGSHVVDLVIQNLPDGVSASITPSSVDVTIAKKYTKSFTVQAELLVGSNQKVSDFESPTLETQTVKITASQAQINSIRIVKALVDCTGQVSDFDTMATLVAYDSKGNKISVEIEPATIKASVKLAKTDEEESTNG